MTYSKTTTRTYCIAGPINTVSGGGIAIPPFTVHFQDGETNALLSITKVLGAGSCTFKVFINGTDVTNTYFGVTSLSVSTSLTEAPANSASLDLLDLDQFSIVIETISGSPVGLTVDFVFNESVS